MVYDFILKWHKISVRGLVRSIEKLFPQNPHISNILLHCKGVRLSSTALLCNIKDNYRPRSLKGYHKQKFFL